MEVSNILSVFAKKSKSLLTAQMLPEDGASQFHWAQQTKTEVLIQYKVCKLYLLVHAVN